ncbi:E3 ubiquitin-protein ligase rnf167 [Clonorchis sinensis]|uniref:E3 ubiquitin-protein ligase rnf167 n=1 Tax=Clonorchis sinensis TaxID=79923 RepID=A0A419PZW0_CLOSI|nr:E3 ubiquitin-protein ligase rnf167 [Clonorchis sinensis]
MLIPPLLLLVLCDLVQSTVYVMNNGIFSVIVTSFEDAVSQFGPELFHVDGFLLIASPPNACTKLQPVHNRTRLNSSSFTVSTEISDVPFVALIQRGDCHFDTKVFNAQMAGYSAAIVYNDVDHVIFPMKGNMVADQIIIPSVMVDRSAGEELKSYAFSNDSRKYLVSVVSFYSLPLKYVLLSLLVLVGISLLILIGCFAAHLCNLWRRIRRGRLSKRHLRRLETKRFVKGQDPYETCPICLEDYKEREKLRLLPCHHAFHINCIDPWLLRNRRRCPVCNRTVDLPGAPRSFSDEEVHGAGPEESHLPTLGLLQRFRHLFFILRRRTAFRHDRMSRTASIASANTLFDDANEESAPLLSHLSATDSATFTSSGVTVVCSQSTPTASQQAYSSRSVVCPVTIEDDQLLILDNGSSQPVAIVDGSDSLTEEVSRPLTSTPLSSGMRSPEENVSAYSRLTNSDAQLLVDLEPFVSTQH